MQVFLINLDRRKDRLASMTAQLASLGLAATRIPAVDADIVADAWLRQFFAPRGPLGTIPKGDQCCSLSHRRSWGAFVTSGAPYAVILEDDVVLDASASRLFKQPDWIPDGIDLIKLEHFGPDHQRVLVGEERSIGHHRTLAPILSRHTGAGCYVVSRAAAVKLLTIRRWSVPVDHLLFNPNVSPLAEELRPFQMLPALARQCAGVSDIRPWRLPDRRLSLKLARREIVRAYYECRLLPKQIAALVAGEARLARVAAAFDQLPAPDPITVRTGTRA
jgi:glycosyl transferase family 25